MCASASDYPLWSGGNLASTLSSDNGNLIVNLNGAGPFAPELNELFPYTRSSESSKAIQSAIE